MRDGSSQGVTTSTGLRSGSRGALSQNSLNPSFGSLPHPLKLTELPIYQLLKSFKLQQYARKINDMGYG